jgi:hypothetical protein
MIRHIAEWFGGLGAALLLIPLALLVLAIVGVAHFYAKKLTGNKWLAAAIGILVFLLCALMTAPSFKALTGISCRHADDYQACIDGDD